MNILFFGTLLGIVRDNSLIDGDDDVDLYVNIKDKDKLIQILDHNIEVNLTLPMNKAVILFKYLEKLMEKRNNRFYLYETELEELHYRKMEFRRWNHIDQISKDTKNIYLPNKRNNFP